MIRSPLRFKLFDFTAVHLIGFTLSALAGFGKTLLALLLADILQRFVPGSFPRFRAASANCRKYRREQYGFKQIDR